MHHHCCDEMRYHVFETDLTNGSDAENKIVYFSPCFREYGIPVMDGCTQVASSYIIIRHCPWCGKELPDSKREEWFDALEKLGYDEPLVQDIPQKFRTSAWYAEDH